MATLLWIACAGLGLLLAAVGNTFAQLGEADGDGWERAGALLGLIGLALFFCGGWQVLDALLDIFGVFFNVYADLPAHVSRSGQE